MLEPRRSSKDFKWRRTAFTRIDGAVDIAEDDWSLMIDGLSAARIYECAKARTMGDGSGLSRSALVASRSIAGRATLPNWPYVTRGRPERGTAGFFCSNL